MDQYRFGTLVFIPSGELQRVGDELRREYDPVSARISPAHLTITQPALHEFLESEWQILRSKIATTPKFKLQIGPAIASPNQQMIWFEVTPHESILELRESLHDLSFFNLDLPFTKGFIPHLTISEKRREPSEVKAITDRLNQRYQPWEVEFDHLTWIVPNENFEFQKVAELPLSQVSCRS